MDLIDPKLLMITILDTQTQLNLQLLFKQFTIYNKVWLTCKMF